MHKHPPGLPECGSKTVMKILLSTGNSAGGGQGWGCAGKLAGGVERAPGINQTCPSCAASRCLGLAGAQHGTKMGFTELGMGFMGPG